MLSLYAKTKQRAEQMSQLAVAGDKHAGVLGDPKFPKSRHLLQPCYILPRRTLPQGWKHSLVSPYLVGFQTQLRTHTSQIQPWFFGQKKLVDTSESPKKVRQISRSAHFFLPLLHTFRDTNKSQEIRWERRQWGREVRKQNIVPLQLSARK